MSLQLAKIVLVPYGGHSNSVGGFERGRVSGSLVEADLIDKFVPAICEELETEGIIHQVIPTRDKPGVPMDKRFTWIDPRSLVVHLRLGEVPEGDPTVTANRSLVYYNTRRSKEIATHLIEAMGEWGRCFVPGHQACRPRDKDDDVLLRIQETQGVRIEPFAVNGPEAETYACYLEQLGRAVGASLAFFMKFRGWGIGRGVAKLSR